MEITTADAKSAEAPSAEKSETNPAKAKPDPIANESAAGDKKPIVEKRGQEEINALRWFESVGVNGFVDWKSIDHPDFPRKKVEVGGFKPFVRTQPPVGLIDSVVGPHTDFLVSLADYLPKIEIRDVLVKKLSSDFYEIECELVNKGFMPTMSEMGHTNNESYLIVVEADFPEGTRLIKGERKTLVSKLDGQGGKRALKWLVRIPTSNPEGIKVPLRAASPTMPAVSILLELKP